MSSRQDRPGRGREAAGHDAEIGVAVGAAIGGLAGLAWALFRKKRRPLIIEEESPVIIKSGSLALRVKDGAKSDIVGKAGKKYQVVSGDFSGKTKWDVSVVELEADFPVRRPMPLADVSSVVLYVVDQNANVLDTITITFDSAAERLNVAAATDNDFGDNTDKETDNSSKKHKLKAVSKKINGVRNFVVRQVTVNHAGGTDDFASGYDYAVVSTFR